MTFTVLATKPSSLLTCFPSGGCGILQAPGPALQQGETVVSPFYKERKRQTGLSESPEVVSKTEPAKTEETTKQNLKPHYLHEKHYLPAPKQSVKKLKAMENAFYKP